MGLKFNLAKHLTVAASLSLAIECSSQALAFDPSHRSSPHTHPESTPSLWATGPSVCGATMDAHPGAVISLADFCNK
jgi:hypothetical protein